MSKTLTFPSPPPTRVAKPEWARNLPDATEDGDPIVYGPRPLSPLVEHVEALAGHELLVTFVTGEVRRVDCSAFLERGVFKGLEDETAFRRVEPINGGGGIGRDERAIGGRAHNLDCHYALRLP